MKQRRTHLKQQDLKHIKYVRLNTSEKHKAKVNDFLKLRTKSYTKGTRYKVTNNSIVKDNGKTLTGIDLINLINRHIMVIGYARA